MRASEARSKSKPQELTKRSLSDRMTTEGNERYRRNGLKHGLTGAGIVIPDEDVKAVEERFEEFETDLRPRNAAARFMAQRAAYLSVRLERCALQESAKITRDMTA